MSYKFTVYDYLVVSLVFATSVFIGLYNAVSLKYGKRIKTFFKRHFSLNFVKPEESSLSEMKEYLSASGKMTCVPIAISLVAMYFSATALLGFPAEVYEYGIEHWMMAFGAMWRNAQCVPIIGAYVTGPLFVRLNVQSVFEYLQIRYQSNCIRLMATCIYIVRASLTTAIFMYAPATTITALTDIKTPVAVIIIGSISTFYTAIGGLKTVLWTDMFQMGITLSGIIAVMIVGVREAGGLNEVWRINAEGGRLNFFDFNPNPFVRQSFWSLVVGTFIYYFGPYCIDQTMLQRYKAAKNRKHAQLAFLLNIPGIFMILSLTSFLGLIVYANYANCDPLSAPNITHVRNPNQLIVYLVTDKMKSMNGFVGLFVSSITSGSLSAVSSKLNAIAIIIWQDFFKQIKFFDKLNDNKSTLTVKLLVLLIGVVSTGLAILVSTMNGNLIQISATLNGALASPILGVFLLAGLVPFSNAYGAFFGIISGFGMGFWLSYGAFAMKPIYPKLGVGTECYLNSTFFNSSFFTNSFSAFGPHLGKEALNLSGFNKFYSLSFTWFSAVGVFSTLLIGCVVSLITCGWRIEPNKDHLLGCIGCFYKSVKISDQASQNTKTKYFETTKL